jgi:Phosphotransferase enzyme family
VGETPITPPWPPRCARLVLLAPGGAVLGALPPMPIATPWWQDIRPVVEAARAAHGIEVTVLRLLSGVRDAPPGGEVTYLAQLEAGDAPVEPWAGTLDDHPQRLPYAKPGGPAADLAWAEGVLEARGDVLIGPPAQERTWNLSSLWRLPLASGAAWLKVVPPFFAHEGDILTRLAGEAVPKIIGHDGPRMLLAELPGSDLYVATSDQLRAMVNALVELQARWMGRADDLLRLGLRDWRAPILAAEIGDLVQRIGADLSRGDREVLEAFVAGLPGRMGRIVDCNLPDTLVHGDFHPGNHRGTGLDLSLLDWGDSGVGHPLLDQPAFLGNIRAAEVESLATHWSACWRALRPDADPDLAASLLAPVAAARKAVLYQGFLDHIEPSEHPYHRADPADWLRRCAALAA